MKIIIITLLLIIPISGFCVSGNAINTQISVKAKADDIKERAEKKKIEDSEYERMAVDNAGGFKRTVDKVKNALSFIRNDGVVVETMKILNCGQVFASGMERRNCSEIARMYGEQNSGGSINWAAGNATIGNGTDTYEIKNKKIFSASVVTTSGLTQKTIFDSKISTFTVSNNVSSIQLKINMLKPSESRVIEATLPVKADTALNQIFKDIDISLSENVILVMLENFYKDKKPAGETFQDVLSNILIDIDTRTSFLKYCQEKSIPMKLEKAERSKKTY